MCRCFGGLVPLVVYCLSAMSLISTATAEDFPEVPDTQVNPPRLSTPAEALASIKVPEGFEAKLFAAEPQIRQPIALTFDARGRLWVAENYTYAESPTHFAAELRDRVVILEDTDGNGEADKRTVFYDQAQQLTSVEVGFGGAWLMTPPQLLFIPDRNGDDVPDSDPVVVLDGFYVGPGNRHNFANGLKWGPDGWLYGRHGITHVGTVGKPGAPNDQRTHLGPGIWRYHPTRDKFETVCTGTTNPWGHDWDEHGELFFINTVIGHLWHGIPGAHFKRMFGADANPYVYDLIDQFADHYHWDTKEAWNDIRKGVTDTTSAAGGGHAHCGLLIYQGDNWPMDYRGKMLTLNLHGRRINRDRLERDAASYVGEHESDDFFFGDQWFRGIDLITGPDGCVYIADWTDVGECHENDGVHRSSGRIFRVGTRVEGRGSRVSRSDLNAMMSEELVGLQTAENDWYARVARRLLQERAGTGQDMTAVHAQAQAMFAGDVPLVHKLRAMWTLYVTGGTSEGWLIKQLAHPEEHVRKWAVRLLVDRNDIPRSTVDALTQMSPHEPSGLVRLYLASSLQRLPREWIWPLAINLGLWKDLADDRVFPRVLWYGIMDAVPDNIEQALVMAHTSRMEFIRRSISRRITQEMSTNPAAFHELLTVITRTTGKSRMIDLMTGVREGLRGVRKAPEPALWQEIQQMLVDWPEDEPRQIAQQIAVVFGDGRAMADLEAVANDAGNDLASRRTALRTLVDARPDNLQEFLQPLLSDRDLSDEAVRGLAAINDPRIATIIINRFGGLYPRGKDAATETLSVRPTSALAMLEAIEAGKVGKEYVTVSQIRQMQQYDDTKLQTLLAKHWPELRPITGEKRSRITAMKEKLNSETLEHANAVAGRASWEKTCAKCHTLFGEGGKIGPDLTGAQRHNLDYLLENIIDPSATLVPNFRMTTIALTDGRVVNGVVLTKTDQAWEVQTATEKLTISAKDVDEAKDSGISLMPDGLLDIMSLEQTADLVKYLMSTRQVEAAKQP